MMDVEAQRERWLDLAIICNEEEEEQRQIGMKKKIHKKAH